MGALGVGALGDTHKPESILPSLTLINFEHFCIIGSDNIVRGQPPTEDIPWRGRSNSAESCAPASKVLACLKCELALPLVQLIG